MTAENLPQFSDFSHGASAADIDGDGDIDLWINNLGGGNAPSYFMVNDGTEKFTIVADIGIPGCSTCAPPIVGTNGRLPQVMARSSGPGWAQFIDANNDGHGEDAITTLSEGRTNFVFLDLKDCK